MDKITNSSTQMFLKFLTIYMNPGCYLDISIFWESKPVFVSLYISFTKFLQNVK